MVMECECFSGLKLRKKVNAQCTRKPVLTASLDSKSNEWQLDWKAGFGFSFVMPLLYISWGREQEKDFLSRWHSLFAELRINDCISSFLLLGLFSVASV